MSGPHLRHHLVECCGQLIIVEVQQQIRDDQSFLLLVQEKRLLEAAFCPRAERHRLENVAPSCGNLEISLPLVELKP